MKKKLSFIVVFVLSITILSGTAFGAGRVLYNGTSGDDVYALQQMLAAYGYFYEEPTGYFGDITENAVIAFQRDFNLEADGYAGPITCSYLGLSTNDDSNSYAGMTVYADESYLDVNLGYRALSNGMSGSDVYTLQALLADYGYFWGEATGYFGDITESAVISFQYDYGLDADGIAGPMTIGTLTGSGSSSSGGSYYSSYADAIVNAAYSTPATSSGYCASWVTQVLRNAGALTYDINDLRPTYYSYASTSGLAHGWYADSTGFNANDYWAYVCYSTDPDELMPGMVVATRSSYTYLGMQFGHVGIYVGDGLIVSSVGYIETLSVDEWYSRYNNTEMGSTMAWGYLPY